MIHPPAALGLHPLRPLTGGHRNAVWLCDSPAGPVVAKTTRRSAAQLDWLIPLQAAARKAGFSVPALITGDKGSALHQGWTIEPFVVGSPASLQDLRRLAPNLHAFHAACPRLPQRPGFQSLPDRLSDTGTNDPEGATLPAPIIDLLRTAWSPFAAAPVQPVHGDVGPANLILAPDGPCLIDWDEARVDLGFLDLVHAEPITANQAKAHLALEIVTCWLPEPDHAQSLLHRLQAMA